MGKQSRSRLIRFSRSTPPFAVAPEDLRGRRILAIDGEPLGVLDDLLLDVADGSVRFLEIGGDGFLGIGERKRLIPVETVGQIDAGHVYLDRSGDHVAGAPVYNPHVVQSDLYLSEVYEYFGLRPPWLPTTEPG